MRDLGKREEYLVLSTTLDTAMIIDAIHPSQLSKMTLHSGAQFLQGETS